MSEEKIIKSYKGFERNMTCRGFQYEEGKEYEEKSARCCDTGFHACEYPLDVFGFYAPGTSVYHEVEQSGKISKDGDCTKVASSKIKIGAEIGIPGLVKAAIEYTKSRTTMEYTDPERATAGYAGAATAGYAGAATAGNRGAATAGDHGAATAGDHGAATAGDHGAATAGYAGAATAGYAGAATSRGSAATGEYGLSVARGNNVRVKGGLGAVLVIAEECDCTYDLKDWKMEVVDGERIKADTWYKLVDGEFVEADKAEE